jgi:type IV pilus assembly protein PilY1
LFTAAKPGVTQPITSGITLATDPATNARWVFFGTGRFMTTSDADDKSTFSQSIYGVKDEDVAYARADLTARTITVTDATSSGYPVRAFQTKEALPLASKGWYVDLPAAGERIVQDAQIVSNFLVTASMIPEGNACESSGTGYINALDAFTGTSGGTSFFNLDNGTTTDDTAVGGLPVGSVNLGVGMPTRPVLLPGQIVLGGSGDGSAAGLGGSPTFGMRWQRVSWREVRQD